MPNSELKIIISAEEIQQRVKELAEQIAQDYEGKDLHVVGILKGSFIFIADLVRALDMPCRVYFLHAFSYGNRSTSSGVVKIQHNLDLTGKDILMVEDILDTGLTLNKILEEFEGQHPASLKICTLLDKPTRRRIDMKSDYIGFQVPDQFIVGYGLDYGELYRNLPHIALLEDFEESEEGVTPSF